MIVTIISENCKYDVGTVIELPDVVGKRWIEQGKAKKYEPTAETDVKNYKTAERSYKEIKKLDDSQTTKESNSQTDERE